MDPDKARHHVPSSQEGIVLSRLERELKVASLDDLAVLCECGQPLVGKEWELLYQSGPGWAIYVKGYCVRGCGVARVMFLSEHPPTPDVAQEKLKAEVEKVLEKIKQEAA